MTYETLVQLVHDYFGDMRRPANKTREDLLALADECRILADTVPDDETDN